MHLSINMIHSYSQCHSLNYIQYTGISQKVIHIKYCMCQWLQEVYYRAMPVHSEAVSDVHRAITYHQGRQTCSSLISLCIAIMNMNWWSPAAVAASGPAASRFWASRNPRAMLSVLSFFSVSGRPLEASLDAADDDDAKRGSVFASSSTSDTASQPIISASSSSLSVGLQRSPMFDGWIGLNDDDDSLLNVAADCWSSPATTGNSEQADSRPVIGGAATKPGNTAEL